jgi:hypothetical protein
VKPEDALERARLEAERKRAEGVYPAATSGADALDTSLAPGAPDLARLREWAIVEVDPELVYSTRRGGAPITWFKKLLLRLMRQYTTELEARQTRFNVGVVAYLERLEKRERD